MPCLDKEFTVKNIALYISIIVIALATGCGLGVNTYATSTGHGVDSVYYSSHNSATETYNCQRVRAEQDDATTEEAFALLARVGLIPSAREVSVRYRDAARLICNQSDRQERGGTARTLPREECERMLASVGGIDADASDPVVSTERVSVDPRVEAMILPIAQMRLYYGLFMADAQRYCQDREASAIVLTNGMPSYGFSAFAPIGAGVAPGLFGAGGFGATAFSNGGMGAGGGLSESTFHARGDIVVNSYGMRPDAIAVVTLNGAPMEVRTGRRDHHLRPAPGVAATEWSVDCMINSVPLSDLHQSGNFGINGGRIELDAICGSN
jgi:hypothetical protein